MEALGLVVGQTISFALFGQILRLNLKLLHQEIDYQKGRQLVAEFAGEDHQ